MERICGPRLSRKRRSTSRVALRKKKLRRVCVKNQRSREGLGCYHGESYHGDASVAPPTDVGAVVRKKGKRRRGREREREKMKKSRNEPLSGEELETDETGMETLSGMEAWQEMGVPLPIIKALKDLGFTSPTAIQQQAIPVAMDTPNDIIGAAETGSGKTLAFSIPILNHIIANDPRATPKSKRSDVMITSSENRGRKDSMPEAEIVDLNLVLHSEEEEDGEEESKDDRFETESGRSLEADDEGASTKKRGLVSCLDDIPEEKFMKMISDSGSPEPTRFRSHDGSHDLGGDVTAESHDGSRDLGMLALILTPTRELALQIRCHIRDAAEYTGIEVCVLVGGMADAKQERMLSRHPPIVVATPGRLWKMMSEGHPYLTSLGSVRYLVLDEADRMIEFGHYHELSRILERLNRVTRGAEFGGVANVRQTFVFSATLSLPRRSSEKRVKVRQKKNLSGQESIDNLISQVGLREDAIVVDVARATGTTETLSEMKIMCSSEEKLVYLYQFLLLYPGRTLIFTNSISTLKRLCSLLELLRLKPHPLHARMQQRQRLKNFDRFSTSSEGLLLASDVAARGLDFPNVHHVIHYDAPLNSELYVHRSGRTARAKREGLSLLLIGPEDMTSYKNICKSLKREGLPSFPMDTSYMRDIRQRVGVARKLETALHRRKKIKRETDWIQSTARALELELDQDWYGMKTDSTGTQESDREQVLKAELKRLLDVPVMPRSVSMMYPTHDSNHKLLKKLAGVAGHERSRQIITTDTNDALKVAKKATSHTTRT